MKNTYVALLILATLLLFSSAANECLAKKEKISRYRVRIDLLSPSKVYLDGEEQQIVILEKVDLAIQYYQYGDPEKTIKILNSRQCKIVDGEENYLEGYLLKDSIGIISILVTKESGNNLVEKHHINVVNHKIGTQMNIPLSEIRKIKVWREGRAGIGAITGVGVGLVASSILTAGYDPEEQSGWLVANKGEFFAATCVLTVPLGAGIGALMGGAKKKVQYFTINGYCDEYYNIRDNLNYYFIEVPVIEENKPDKLSMKSGY